MSNLLKKFKILLIAIVLFFGISSELRVNAVEKPDQISRMEEQLFFRTYNNESAPVRLDRLEATVFGTPNRGESVDTRIKALNKFFQTPSPLQGTALQKLPQSALLASNSQSNNLNNHAPTSSLQKDAEYPVVSVMEQKVFNQVFDTQSLESRLTQLENRVLGQTQRGTLQERTDQLRLMVLGDAGSDRSANFQSPSNNSQVASNRLLQNTSALPSEDVLKGLLLLEKKVLKHTYPQEPIENRLNRLETKVFNSTAPEMSNDDRFYRLVSVMNAQGSTEPYDIGQNNQSGYSSGVPSAKGQALGTFGSMLLMILMSLL